MFQNSDLPSPSPEHVNDSPTATGVVSLALLTSSQAFPSIFQKNVAQTSRPRVWSRTSQGFHSNDTPLLFCRTLDGTVAPRPLFHHPPTAFPSFRTQFRLDLP